MPDGWPATGSMAGGLIHGLVCTPPAKLVPAFDEPTNPLIGDSLDGISGAAMAGDREEAVRAPSGLVVRAAELVLSALGSTLDEAIGFEGTGSPGGAINGEGADGATGSEEAGREPSDSPSPGASLDCLASEDVGLVSPPGMAGSVT